MKKRNGMTGRKRFFSAPLYRMLLPACLFLLIPLTDIAAMGAHEAFSRIADSDYRGKEVFTYTDDGLLPFLVAETEYVPAGTEKDIYGKTLEEVRAEHAPEIALSSEGVRNGNKVTYRWSDIHRPEPEPEEEVWTADELIPGPEEDLWSDSGDLWDDTEDLWGEEDDLWGDGEDLWEDEESLWGDDDAWGDDFWDEEWEENVPNEATREGLNEADADFWADFFIAGEEVEMDLPDGSYFMDLYVNDQYKGNVEFLVEDGKRHVDAEAFRYITSDMVTEEEKSFLESFVSWIPFSEIENRGYTTHMDNIEYVAEIRIPTAVLDTVVLSVAGGGPRGSDPFASRPLANSLDVKNTVFNLETNYSLSMYVPFWPEFDAWNLLDADISVGNRMRLLDVYNQFSFGMSVGKDRFNFRFGLYSFYTDFPRHGLRLSWGNVSGYGRPSRGVPIGFKLEKNSAFYDASWKRKSYVSREIVLESRSDVIVMNGEKEIFRSELEMGTYLLEDFILSSGGNDISIIIKPKDGSPERTLDFKVLYGHSLLAPGENWWGFSLLGGRTERSTKAVSPFALSVPYGKDAFLEYDVRNFSLGFYFDIGLCRGLTMRTRGSLTNNPTDTVDWSPSMRLDASFIHTNSFANMTFSSSYWNTSRDGELFGHNVSSSFMMSFGTGWKALSSMSLSLGYDWNHSDIMQADMHSSRFSLTTGGRLGFLNWSASGSGYLDWNRPSAFTWSASSSLSFAAGRHASVSASFSVSRHYDRDPVFSLRVGISAYFGGVSMSTSADMSGNIDFRVSGGYGGHSASGSISTNWNNDWDTGISAYYSYFGKYLSLSSGVSSGIRWKDRNGAFAPSVGASGMSLSLSTSSLFADGFFQMRSSIPYNYLMVRQKGALRGNTLTTASGNSSSEDYLFRQFGIGTIDGVGGYRDEYLTLYSQNENGENYYTYNIRIPASKRNGYLIVLEEDYRYTSSGIVEGWINASSPLYSVTVETAEDGSEFIELGNTDEFVFSDETGRFLSPALLPGRYAFDVPVGDGSFRLIMFDIPSMEREGGVIMMDGMSMIEDVYVSEAYSEYLLFTNGDVITMDEYWSILYPEEEEDEFYFGDSFSDDLWAASEDGDSLWADAGDDDLWADLDAAAEDDLWSDIPYEEDPDEAEEAELTEEEVLSRAAEKALDDMKEGL